MDEIACKIALISLSRSRKLYGVVGVVEQLVSGDARVDFTECELQKTRSASTRGSARYRRT